MNKYKKVFKFFLVGEEDKECEWLEEMSKRGYHLKTISFLTYYTFELGTPSDYKYYIDMKNINEVDEGEYVSVHEDCGLEYLDKSRNFYYFRGKESEEVTNLLNDDKGRYLDRLSSQKWVMLFVALLNLFICLGNVIHLIRQDGLSSGMIYMNLIIGLFCLFMYNKTNRKIKSLINEGVKIHYKTGLKDWNGFIPIISICVILMIVYSIVLVFNI